MFDRFGVVEATSPVGARGAALAAAVHLIVLGIGLHSAHQAEGPAHPQAIPIYLPSAPHRPAQGLERVQAPAVGPVTNLPIMPTIDPGPIGVITHYSPEQLFSPGPGDPVETSETGVFDSRVVQDLPELLSAPPPRYPDVLRLAGFEGVVVLEGVVDTLGRFERGSLRVRSSPHPQLSASALESMEGALFRPGRVYGRAVRVLVQVPVQFRIAR